MLISVSTATFDWSSGICLATTQKEKRKYAVNWKETEGEALHPIFLQASFFFLLKSSNLSIKVV